MGIFAARPSPQTGANVGLDCPSGRSLCGDRLPARWYRVSAEMLGGRVNICRRPTPMSSPLVWAHSPSVRTASVDVATGQAGRAWSRPTCHPHGKRPERHADPVRFASLVATGSMAGVRELKGLSVLRRVGGDRPRWLGCARTEIAASLGLVRGGYLGSWAAAGRNWHCHNWAGKSVDRRLTSDIC